MPPRRRRAINRDLPKGLYSRADGTFQYKHPQTGKYHGMGTDRARAIRAANRLNDLLAEKAGQTLVDGVMKERHAFRHVLDRYEGLYFSKKKLAPSTRKNALYKLRLFRKKFGDHDTRAITVKMIAEHLNGLGPDAYPVHRALLIEIFKFAVAQGDCEVNVAATTMEQPARPEKKRRRLTLEQFNAIRDRAEPWMQIAMDLALLTLQGRLEISRMRFDDVKGGYLYVVRQKTKHQTDRAYMRIAVGPQLQAIIDRARDGLLTPFIVHRKPTRRRRAYLDKKDHWTQVAAAMITRKFSDLRDGSGLFEGVPADERPTFHEIRSLGSHLYEKAGADLDQVNRLLGHTSEKMTKHYQDGHGVTWTDCVANLEVKGA